MATPVQPFRSACFFSTDNGATVQRRTSANDESGPNALPSGVTNLYRFDEKPSNNAALLALWETDSSRFTMSGNTVLVDDLPAGFDPPGLLFRALQNASVLYAKMESTPDALTREEQAQLGAIGFRALGLIS